METTGTPSRSGLVRVRTVGYWICTGLIAQEMVAGAFWDFLHIEFVRVVFAHLGYPLYLLVITGVWKIPCAVVLMLPRFLRLKEWAYAGAVFLYTGAAASHMFAGDRAGKWSGPLVFALFTLGSWALRPHTRRLTASEPPPKPTLRGWLVPAAVLGVMTIVGLVTIPQGPPPP
jgi:hypothetical protein